MNRKTLVRTGMAALVILGGSLLMPSQANAQMGGGPPAEVMAKIKKWQKWSEAHKSTSNLNDLIYQISEIDRTPGLALNKAQAGKVLGLIKPYMNKAELSEDESKSLAKAMTNVLTTKQLQKVATIVPPSKKWGRGGGGGGRPAGGPPKGGMTNFPDPPKSGYNPLNPDTFPMAQVRPMMKAGINSFMTGLKNAK